MGVDYMLPNIVVDRKAGLIWSLDINLDALSCNFTDDFLYYFLLSHFIIMIK